MTTIDTNKDMPSNTETEHRSCDANETQGLVSGIPVAWVPPKFSQDEFNEWLKKPVPEHGYGVFDKKVT